MAWDFPLRLRTLLDMTNPIQFYSNDFTHEILNSSQRQPKKLEGRTDRMNKMNNQNENVGFTKSIIWSFLAIACISGWTITIQLSLSHAVFVFFYISKMVIFIWSQYIFTLLYIHVHQVQIQITVTNFQFVILESNIMWICVCVYIAWFVLLSVRMHCRRHDFLLFSLLFVE